MVSEETRRKLSEAQKEEIRRPGRTKKISVGQKEEVWVIRSGT
jgi:hypothetical protein